MTANLFLYGIIGIATALASPITARAVAATNATALGMVQMYEYDELKGYSVKIPIRKVNTCYNLDCFYNKMSSAKWELPTGWYIGFYTDGNCRGNHYWRRPGIHRANVASLYAAKPKMDNAVSSMIVLKLGAGPLTYTEKCPSDTTTTGGDGPGYLADVNRAA